MLKENKMKLQFEENEYYLLKDGEELAIATTDESLIKELGAEMLSRENCEAIANSYDLDELAEENYEIPIWTEEESLIRKLAFKKGFQKAVEILGDKKFSEEDLVSFGKRCFYKGFEKSENDDANCYTAFREEIGELIQSIQQTEWEVSFNPDEKDSKGCLILKRK